MRRTVLACLLLAAPAALAAETSPPRRHGAAPAFEALAPGLAYRREARPDGPLSIHVLRIDRARPKWQLHTGLGQGTVFGLEPLDGIVRRTEAGRKRTALAAINGDFFVIKAGPYQGDPQGVQIVQGELVSRPAGNSFWVAADGGLRLGPVASRLRAVWPDGKTETPLGLNEERADGDAVLYTPRLGLRPGEPVKTPPTTRTQGGRELVLEAPAGGPWLPPEAGKTYAARVREVRQSGGTALLPGQAVLSLGPQQAAQAPEVKPGEVLRLVMETRPDLSGVRTAIGAGRILVQDGKTPDVGPTGQPRHPRSMIGWNRQHLYLTVIDGRQKGLSIGMTYPEMAALAREYGCTDAIELDGGGSSTLWAMGRMLNSPSDGRLRPIANALVVLPVSDVPRRRGASNPPQTD